MLVFSEVSGDGEADWDWDCVAPRLGRGRGRGRGFVEGMSDWGCVWMDGMGSNYQVSTT